jgi:outer membrane protein TolC
MTRRTSTSTRWLSVLPLAAALSGCASFSNDGGFGPVAQTTRDRLGQEASWQRSPADRDRAEARVAELLKQPLSADAAVQIALLNNRGLQAAFHELGIAEADVVQAGRLPNPGFSLGRSTQGDEVEREIGVHVNLARLILMPTVQRIESRRFAQVQGAVTSQVLALAAETRKAWVQAVAADEGVRYTQLVQQAAEASAELARRMAQVGNWNKLQQAREQGFYADAALNLARAEQVQRSSRERLIRLMGLWGAQLDFRLPERLPDLPAAPKEWPNIEQTAMAQRLDVQAAKAGAEKMAQNLGLTKATRFINVLEFGATRATSNEMPVKRGYEVGFELPLFDWGDARVAKSEAVYMQAVEQAAQAAIDARSEAREAYGAYRSSFDIARHLRDEVVPLKKRIADENLLRYNGMLIGVFELLADARSQIASVNASIEALRDFWLAQADLDMALLGKPSLSATTSSPMAPAEAGAAH